MASHLLLKASVAGALVGGFGSLSAAQYTIIDLGTLGGSTSASVAINSDGRVAGSATTAGDAAIHGFVTRRGKSDDDDERRHQAVVDLGTLGGTHSGAYAINARGDVVGAGTSAGNATLRAFLFNGKMSELGTLGGSSSAARGLNDDGQVVGYAATAGNAAVHAFLHKHGRMSDLGTLGGTNSVASAINDRGDVVGDSQIYGSLSSHAFLYANGRMWDLGTLGGTNSSAADINERGKVVGSASTANDAYTHAFLFAKGKMRDLGTLGGYNSDAFGINAKGMIVGTSQTSYSGAGSRAFEFNGCKLVDLNTLVPLDSGWILTEARAINNAGQIVGFGVLRGQSHAFLLSPKGEREHSAADSDCDRGDD